MLAQKGGLELERERLLTVSRVAGQNTACRSVVEGCNVESATSSLTRSLMVITAYVK